MTDAPETPKAGPWRIFLESESRVWTLNYQEEAQYQAARQLLCALGPPGQAPMADERTIVTVTDDHGLVMFRWGELKFIRCVDYAGVLQGDMAYTLLERQAHKALNGDPPTIRGFPPGGFIIEIPTPDDDDDEPPPGGMN